MDCLLTITILTFNSEKYISDTLLSVANQANKSLQLVISDDNSSDKTVGVIQSFLETYEKLFFEVVLLVNDENIGILGNKKRTFPHIKGKWVKGLAGDDMLEANAIKNMEEDMEEFKHHEVIVGQAQIFRNNQIENLSIPNRKVIHRLIDNTKIKNYLFEGYTIPAICLLVKSELLIKSDPFKNAKRNFEDVPFHLELLSNNVQFVFSNKQYILYRKHENNVSSKHKEDILSRHYIDYQKILLKYAIRDKRFLYTLNSFWNLAFGTMIIQFGNKGKFLSMLNWMRVKLQPKRMKNAFIAPF